MRVILPATTRLILPGSVRVTRLRHRAARGEGVAQFCLAKQKLLQVSVRSKPEPVEQVVLEKHSAMMAPTQVHLTLQEPVEMQRVLAVRAGLLPIKLRYHCLTINRDQDRPEVMAAVASGGATQAEVAMAFYLIRCGGRHPNQEPLQQSAVLEEANPK